MARNAVFILAAFGGLTLVGFWPTYFVRLQEMASWRVHAHGALMFAWCVLLVAQAYLMRSGRRDWHRALGKSAFVLAPVMVLSGLIVERDSLLRAASKLDAEALFFAWVAPAVMAVFAIAVTLALLNRKTPALHMRYMLTTPLALLDPVLARILEVRLGIGFGSGQMITFALTDAILLWLCVRDKRSNHKAYPVMLIVFLAFQLPAFFVYKMAWWPGVVMSAIGS